MSQTPEKADDGVCPSTNAFHGEPTYRCVLADWHPHQLHDDGEHHRWFDAIPEFVIEDWQAALYEAFVEQIPDAGPEVLGYSRGFVKTGRALLEQAEGNAKLFNVARVNELQRRVNEDVAKIAAVTQTPAHYRPADEATVADLTAELRRLDHEIAEMRMRPAKFPLSEAHIRERRERVRQARARLERLEAHYTTPRYSYPDLPTSAEAFAALQAPRLAQFEVLQEAFASPFRQVMEAAKKGADEMAKKKAENLGLPKVEYILCDDGGMRPLNSEAAKADHVMTRDGGQLFGIARWSKEPIPDGTTIRMQGAEDLHIGLYASDAAIDWQDPVLLSAEAKADALRKLVEAGEVRTTSSTGGEKGVKPARFDLIPIMPLTKLAEHYGAGAAKYASHQWRRGYELSKSYAALQRHVTAFWDGEDIDPEMGTPHLSAVIFHAMAMQQILADFPQHDDRYKKES